MVFTGIFTAEIDAPLDYAPMLKRLVGVIRRKHYEKGLTYKELGVKRMMGIVRKELEELEAELEPEDGYLLDWWKVEREANHLALASLLVADIARLNEAKT